MDIFELKKKKQESKMTNQEIADLSGIPVSTVNKIFSGATRNPRYETLLAIEEVLAEKKTLPFYYDELKQMPSLVRETGIAYCYGNRPYQEKDWELLSEQTRAEIVNHQLYMMAAPGRKHQSIVGSLFYQIKDHIIRKKGNCEVCLAPFDVKLFPDDATHVQPDISIICDEKKLTDWGCQGAPDWVIEVLSPSNKDYDCVIKMMQYQKSGVREYWIVDPEEEKVYVYNFEDREKSAVHEFAGEIASGVLEGLTLTLS
jgi:Uma2 family endonuclease